MKSSTEKFPGTRRINSLTTTFERLWLVVLLLFIWWFASIGSTSVFFPSLQLIFATLVQDLVSGLLVENALFSLSNLFQGLMIAIVTGSILGLLIGESRRLREVLDPFIHMLRSIPQAALVPLVIGAFGLGPGPKIQMIALACVFPVLLNTIDGVRAIEPTIRRFANVYRIPPLLYFRRVILPGTLPQLFAGIRVALPIGIVIMVVSELFAANQGIGFYILNSSTTFHFEKTWAGAFLVGILGYALACLLFWIEKIVLRWYFESGTIAK